MLLTSKMKVRPLPRAPLLRKAGRYKLAAPVSKTGSASPRSEHYRRLPPAFARRASARQAKHQPSTKGKTMKPVIRYQSQLLFRKSYKPNRIIRIRPVQKLNLVFRPSRAGPQIKNI